MTAATVDLDLRPGDIVELSSSDVICSRCGKPTAAPVFIGYADVERERRLPVWGCAPCAHRERATS